tara:strand:- start:63 stop:584 length:522 start_codon:yes stop_codon:yes gene_type:complete
MEKLAYAVVAGTAAVGTYLYLFPKIIIKGIPEELYKQMFFSKMNNPKFGSDGGMYLSPNEIEQLEYRGNSNLAYAKQNPIEEISFHRWPSGKKGIGFKTQGGEGSYIELSHRTWRFSAVDSTNYSLVLKFKNKHPLSTYGDNEVILDLRAINDTMHPYDNRPVLLFTKYGGRT